jgi:6-phosphogluconolactonase (cycloisomerase 2 family)
MTARSRTAAAALAAAGLATAVLTAPGPVAAGASQRDGAQGDAELRAATPSRAVYVTGDVNHKIAAHAIGATGGLTALGAKDLPPASGPEGVAVSPDGRHVYVTTYNDDKVTHYPVNANGSLGTPTSVTTGFEPYAVDLTPDGKYLFTGNYAASSISRFRVNPGGSLSSLGAATVAPNGVYPLAISPHGRFLFHADGTSIGTMIISATGGLTVTGTPVSTNVSNPYGLVVTPDGKYLYAVNGGGSPNVSGYTVSATGALTPVGAPVPVGAGVNDIRMTPDGRFLFTADYGANAVTVIRVLGNGHLTAVGSPFAMPGKGPAALAVAPSGRTLYSANYTTSDISQLTIAANGTLSQATGSPFASSVVGPDYFAIATTPNQGPVAKITKVRVGTAVAGEPVTLNARRSFDTDGKIVRYSWTFGDGKSRANGSRKQKHTYKKPGTYKVRLVVTDDERCSDTDITTGHTLHCNATTKAVKKIKVRVVKP